MLSHEEQSGASPERLNRAEEDYLKAILILQRRNGSVAVKLLREGGFLSMDEDKHIRLMDIGRETAEEVFEKHCVLSECLIALGVDPDTADKDACRMEHIVSRETIDRMSAFVNRGKEECNITKKKNMVTPRRRSS